MSLSVPYTIEKLSDSSIDSAKLIVDQRLGNDYFNTSNVLDLFPNSFVFKDSDGEVQGVITSKVITDNSVNLLPNKYITNSNTLYIGTIAVAPGMDGNGIATMLMDRVLATANTKTAAMMGWVSGHNIPVQGLATKYEFTNVAKHKNYWLEDSVENQYQCADCGSPCQCDAILFFKQME